MGKKRSTIKCYEKLLREDRDYDYAYLLELEQFKLRRMVKNFSEAPVPHVGIEFTIRDLRMCVSLLDIILERDAPYKTYLDEHYGPNGKVKMSIGEDNILKVDQEPDSYKTPVHVNTRNYWRFGFKKEPKNILWMDYRRVKALRLYNKLRNRLFHWWW